MKAVSGKEHEKIFQPSPNEESQESLGPDQEHWSGAWMIARKRAVRKHHASKIAMLKFQIRCQAERLPK